MAWFDITGKFGVVFRTGDSADFSDLPVGGWDAANRETHIEAILNIMENCTNADILSVNEVVAKTNTQPEENTVDGSGTKLNYEVIEGGLTTSFVGGRQMGRAYIFIPELKFNSTKAQKKGVAEDLIVNSGGSGNNIALYDGADYVRFTR